MNNKECYVSPEVEIIEVGIQDWLLDYGGGNQETPEPAGDQDW